MKLNSARTRRRVTAVGLAAVLAATGIGFTAVPAVAAAPAAAAASAPTPIVPKPVSAQVGVDANGTPLGAITGVSQKGSAVTLSAEHGSLRVTFLEDGTFRIEADPSGDFTDPANTSQNDPARSANIVVGTDSFGGAAVTVTEGDSIRIASKSAVVTIDRATSTIAAARADGTVLFAESAPISFGATTATQHLSAQDGEQFLGGGMQNGRSIHTGSVINIASSYDWDDGGNPNAVPYYMTSQGYGVLRNTFAPGTYDFKNGTTTHQERRFDAYYFVGDYGQALESYTQLTGRPLLPPIYALEYGDADCYNRSNPTYQGARTPSKLTTPQSLDVAKGFVENDMPAGWMLVNDGYGCEYQELPETVAAIEAETGLKTGLWTQRSLTEQEYEVGEAGIRLRKLDVAWVGEGYRLALTGCEAAHQGIEDHSDARGTSLMVEGWAGSQRCGMQWTGDHTGSLDAVRWQISALTGAGNSGLAFTTGDVDGIFGGSAESYVRDLQWKAFAPALYSMSGWAPVDKRPWLYGEEATAINRSYLQLRQQLLPYIYTLAQQSHSTGMPMMRSLALNYPQDAGSYSVEANNEFMLGDDYLVAPVFTQTTVRNGIYLPAGTQWVDYWTGRLYEGGQVVNGHAAPLDRLPVFVRAGAVVPQGIVARNSAVTAEDAPITLSVYPQGDSTFTLYEDDKTTRAHAAGDSSTQTFSVQAPSAGKKGSVTVTIGQREGSYEGKADARPYVIEAHTGSAPKNVVVDGKRLTEASSLDALAGLESGWFFDGADAGGVITVKLAPVKSASTTQVELTATSAVGGRDADASAAEVSVEVEERIFQGDTTTVTATFRNTGTKKKEDVVLVPTAPEGWKLLSSTGDRVPLVEAGGSATASFVFEVPEGTAGGLQTVSIEASYSSQKAKSTASGANQLYVAYGSLAGAYNADAVTSIDAAKAGDFDGGGATFSAEALARAGVSPGTTVAVGDGDAAISYTWPAPAGAADSVAPAGQTIALRGTGTHLAVLASAASGGGVTPKFELHYTDGTVSTQGVFFPNWLPQASGLGGATLAIRSLGRNSASNPDVYEYTTSPYQVYSNLIRLNPAKELAYVVLPTESRVKIFDWKVVDQPLPPAPSGTIGAAELPWLSATNGWGVIGKNVANKDEATSPDAPLAINYTDPATGTQPRYETGLGVHAQSKITYYLGGACSSFTAEVGLEAGFAGNVIFKVDGDDVNLYQSRTFTPGFAPEKVNVDLAGVQYVDLVVEAPGSINGAHGVWGEAAFHCE
ncbi:NPCBM/NEW2 domain-containing protein [Microbacterium sp. M28]|uniref:NPCBM/NEW2 domain-containing protein n=1 Tax=Microbacterium sp. M28 TaxID=2962064 RepID=UPI0021F4236F|nr:NPCBM/NEW2 domain-containing protein [Microbacterium sp. M28]UYO97802.1 NPCBM/NEW2 domain-containing protein [Microbacterium sp. M28]